MVKLQQGTNVDRLTYYKVPWREIIGAWKIPKENPTYYTVNLSLSLDERMLTRGRHTWKLLEGSLSLFIKQSKHWQLQMRGVHVLTSAWMTGWQSSLSTIAWTVRNTLMVVTATPE